MPSRFAQFCRRHSIDELPQVVNVLTGPGRLVSSEVTGSTDRMRELERGIHSRFSGDTEAIGSSGCSDPRYNGNRNRFDSPEASDPVVSS